MKGIALTRMARPHTDLTHTAMMGIGMTRMVMTDTAPMIERRQAAKGKAFENRNVPFSS